MLAGESGHEDGGRFVRPSDESRGWDGRTCDRREGGDFPDDRIRFLWTGGPGPIPAGDEAVGHHEERATTPSRLEPRGPGNPGPQPPPNPHWGRGPPGS